MIPSPKRCSRCQAPMGRDASGRVCTACLLEEVLPVAEGLSSLAVDCESSVDAAFVQRVGPYELLEEIGRGGMGVIYRARQPGLDRVVALKMLLAGEFADAKARERLMREAKIAARLNHPGIVTIHDVGEQGGRPYFAMEYVPGRNLAQQSRDGLLPVATAVRYVEQLARAVHYAHQHGVIHRDLKPANVLISPEDEPKLTDFGLTKSLVDPTQTVESAGSPNFMAPEQADSGLGTTGTPTDIYGLGAILYYLLTGRPPAVGESLAETLRAVVECEPVPPTQLRPALARDLETITLKCLEKEPGRRYGSAESVAEELARWRRHEPILARPASTAERFGKWVRRRPIIAALSAACAVAVILGFAGITWQWRRAEVQRERALINELSARRNSYVAELTLANEAATRGHWQDVRTILNRTQPDQGQEDLRGWEWRYLWQASRLGAAGRLHVSAKPIRSMTALEDGRTVALGETEGGFSIWDISTGRETYRLPGAINRIRHPTHWGGAPIICRVVVVPGTGLLAYTECISPTNGMIHLWHVARREVVRSIPVPGMPRYLASSPDGSRVACSLMLPERRTQVFSVTDGLLVASIATELSDYSVCQALAFTADSQSLCLEDAKAKSMRLVHIGSGQDLHRFPYGQEFPLTVAVSPDGRWLVTGAGFDNKLPRVLVWDLQTGERRKELPAGSGSAIGFSPDGRRLVTGLSVWRVPEFTLERKFDGMDENFNAALLLPDGDTLLTEDGRGGVLRWQLSAPPVHRRGFSLGEAAVCLAFLPNAEGLLLTRTNGQVDRMVAPDFKPTAVPTLGLDAVGIAWTTDPVQLAVARTDGAITLHASDTFVEIGRIGRTTHVPTGVSYWVHKAGLLVLGTGDDQLEAWDVRTRQRVWQSSILPRRELTAPTPEGVLWQVHADGWLAGYDVVRRRVIRQPLDHDGIHRVSVSDDGKWLLTTSPEGSMHLVDTGTWRTISHFEHLDLASPHGGSFWPGADRIAFSGLHVVDRVTGRRLLSLDPEFAFPSATFVSSSGSLVVTGGSMRRVYLWRAPSWEEIRREESTAGW